MGKGLKLAKDAFNDALNAFTEAGSRVEEAHNFKMLKGLVDLAAGLSLLCESIEDIGNMLNRVERGTALERRGPTGLKTAG